MGLYESYSSEEPESEWDRSIFEEMSQGVSVPDEIQKYHDEEKIEARIATTLAMGMVAAAIAYEVRRYRRNH